MTHQNSSETSSETASKTIRENDASDIAAQEKSIEAPPPIAAASPDVTATATVTAFPDGGRKAWLTVAGGAACLFVSFGWVNCVGIFQYYYLTNQLRDYSPSQVAWIPSLEFSMMLFGGPFAGKLFDNYGPRVPILLGTFLHVFGLMMTSISHEYYQFILSQSICSSIGASMLFTPALSAIQTYFLKKRAAAVGLSVAGSSIGGVIFPIMARNLLPEVGFGWTIRIAAFIILALGLFATLTVTSHIRPKPRPLKAMDYINPFKDPKYALYAAATFLYYWSLLIPLTYIVVEAQYHGMSPGLAYYLVPIFNAAGFFGRTIPNVFADRFGNFNVVTIMSTICMILLFGLWLPATGNGPIILFAALFGFFSGSGISLAPVCIASISPLSEIGVRLGVNMAVGAIASVTSPPIAGAILDRSGGSYVNVAIYAGACMGVGILFIIGVRVQLVGWRLTKV